MMQTTQRAKAKKVLIYADWSRPFGECDGCGVEVELYASIFNREYRPWLQPDNLRFCENCWEKVGGDG